ncbi:MULTISPECIES: hypothetical protein [Spirosoma]|uniref:Lipoprotein n=1 Tax=Spirosoma sordidisoli TaxID=2502893 RepID=A0A4Q2UVL6_9BACT|nr:MULTISPECIES: hypothetical protein [Spirosoma]RYC72061.1 hypothetical protein EQG79_08055 [Spirosoma sordidisoli]
MFMPFRVSLAVPALCLLILGSCKKDEVDPTKGFSTSIQSLIAQDDIETLRQRGMPIYEGTVPPNIEGIYMSAPHELVSPYGPDDTFRPGDEFTDLILRFSEQTSTDQRAKVELKTGNSTGAGQGGFIAGNGTQFTFFAEIDLKSGAATAKQIRIFSGEMTSDGIKNLYTTLYMKSKNDPSDELIPVGTSRIIKDGDGLASKRTSFRAGADAVEKPTDSAGR